MKISVLLPTKNGARFLAGAIESVLRQPLPADEMELVISDNASTDETAAVADRYTSDPRVRYARLAAPVPVTDNWNAALGRSAGDYTLMIGDDDALLPRSLVRLRAALEAAGRPECLGFNGVLFVAPGSVPGWTRSRYKSPYHPCFDHLPAGAFLPAPEREQIVRRMFRFDQSGYPLNMQLTAVARTLAERVRGGLFQPPFPDHYALNACLLEARTFAVTNERLVVVGVSPKSYGHFHHAGRHAEGMRFLGAESRFPGRIEGSEMVNSMHRWLLRLAQSYPDRLRGASVDRTIYREMQIDFWLDAIKASRGSIRDAARVAARVPAPVRSVVFARVVRSMARRLLRGRQPNPDEIGRFADATAEAPGVSDILGFVDWVETHDAS